MTFLSPGVSAPDLLGPRLGLIVGFDAKTKWITSGWPEIAPAATQPHTLSRADVPIGAEWMDRASATNQRAR